MTVSRRSLLGWAVAGGFAATGPSSVALGAKEGRGKPSRAELTSLTTGAQPISADEHGARIGRVQALMQQRGVAALLVESGSSLQYFTGVQWHRSERTTAALIPAEGRAIVVTPFFEEPSIRETLKIPADVRPWKEDESPFALIASAVADQTSARGPVAMESTTRFFIVDHVRSLAGHDREVISGEDLVRACRTIKSPAELALMQTANDVTIRALKQVHGAVEVGMSGTDILQLMVTATEALGGSHEFSLVLLNEASAYPHGSRKPQQVHPGSVILIDSGCTVHGYQSDISRSWVFGEASPRQRKVWNTVKRGQEIALETARLGTPAGAIDRAVRAFYEQQGYAKDYGLPGLSHRTGHGIGLDGHEPPYLVRNDETPLQAGMCFSDEPGIYIPGEFGIRLEDCWYLTEAGPKLFTPLAKSLDQPI